MCATHASARRWGSDSAVVDQLPAAARARVSASLADGADRVEPEGEAKIALGRARVAGRTHQRALARTPRLRVGMRIGDIFQTPTIAIATPLAGDAPNRRIGFVLAKYKVRALGAQRGSVGRTRMTRHEVR